MIDGGDPIALAFYEHSLRAGMVGPPQLKPYVITTLYVPFEPLMANAAGYYATDDHVESPLGADDARAVVLTLGTLTVLRLGPDAAARHASFSYRGRRPDVILLAVAAWRNDRPGGFLLKAVFATRAQGERFSARYKEQIVPILASRPSREAVEEELRRAHQTPTAERAETSARVFALVRWLESSGALTHDENNGVELLYGSEIELQNASELARELGDHRGDLS